VKPTTEERQSTRPRRAARARIVSLPTPQSISSSSVRSSGLRLLAFLIATAAMATPALAADALVLEPDPPILIGLIVGFVVLMFPTNQLIFKPIFRALDERDERIEGARSRATQIQRDADTVLADYESRIREARIDADTTRKEQIAAARTEQGAMTGAARSEAEAQIERARATLASDLEDARQSMRADAQELARSAAEQILGRSL